MGNETSTLVHHDTFPQGTYNRFSTERLPRTHKLDIELSDEGVVAVLRTAGITNVDTACSIYDGIRQAGALDLCARVYPETEQVRACIASGRPVIFLLNLPQRGPCAAVAYGYTRDKLLVWAGEEIEIPLRDVQNPHHTACFWTRLGHIDPRLQLSAYT